MEQASKTEIALVRWLWNTLRKYLNIDDRIDENLRELMLEATPKLITQDKSLMLITSFT